MIHKIVILMFLATVAVFGSIGVDVIVQKPFNATGNWPVISVGILKNAPKPPLYFSSGIILRPGTMLGVESAIDLPNRTRKTHSFFGIYAGTHIGFSPAVRPGIVAGCSFKRDEVFGVSEGKQVRLEYTPYKISPIFGISLHCFILSFLVTNEGIGGGVNYSFGR